MSIAMATASKIRIRRVLYVTDFSDESAHAASYLRDFRRGYHAEVSVVHVLDVFPFSLSPTAADTARIAELREKGKARVLEFMQAHGFSEAEFKPVVLTGEVSLAVEQFARENTMDLIVLGSRGKVGMNRLFQGSMAEEIFRTAQCPVMVVGPESKEPGGSFKRVFLPTDLSPTSQAALPYIEFILRENEDAKVSLAHFVERDPETPYERHKMRRLLERDLIALVDPGLRSRIEEVVVEFSAPAEGMISMVRGLGAELLLLGVRQGGSWTRASTHGLRSITHQVISRSPCPVLTVRGS
jgi:nucleotide-binding universal stress UspA family protein